MDVAAVVAAAGAGIGVFVATRGGDEVARVAAPPAAAPVVREPTAGLAAVKRFEEPTGEDLDLGSHSMWQTATADFEAAAAQPGAPAHYAAAAHFARGKLAMTRGETVGAIEAEHAAIAAEPTWAAPHAALATALAEAGKVDEALLHVVEAQRLEPERWAWIATGASIHAAAEQLDDAIAEYQRALRLAPEEPALHASIALVYHAAGLDGPAHDHAAKALAANPEMVGPRLVEAELALERQDGANAREHAAQALARAPHSVPAMLGLADADVLLGNDEDALAMYRKAAEEAVARAGGGATPARVAEAQQIAQLGSVAPARARLAPPPATKQPAKKKSFRSRKKINLNKECLSNPLACK